MKVLLDDLLDRVLRTDRLTGIVPVQSRRPNLFNRPQTLTWGQVGVPALAQAHHVVRPRQARRFQGLQLLNRDIADVGEKLRLRGNLFSHLRDVIEEPVEAESVHGHNEDAGRTASGKRIGPLNRFLHWTASISGSSCAAWRTHRSATAVTGLHVDPDLSEHQARVAEPPTCDGIGRGEDPCFQGVGLKSQEVTSPPCSAPSRPVPLPKCRVTGRLMSHLRTGLPSNSSHRASVEAFPNRSDLLRIIPSRVAYS